MHVMLTEVETRIPMSWNDYEVYDAGDYKAEYFGGELVIHGSPSHRHQDVIFELLVALKRELPEGCRAVSDWGWSPDGFREELRPDLVVHSSRENKRLTSSAPLLVVEVLSPNRRTDLVDKMQRYAKYGAVTYWIVDPRDHELVVHDLDEGIYRVTAVHTDGVVRATYGGHEVDIDLDALFD